MKVSFHNIKVLVKKGAVNEISSISKITYHSWGY
jgi:hypothetical protein